MKKSLQQKQEEFLIDALEYYSTDVKRRCVDTDGGCRYSPVNANKDGISEGCLIGRKISKNLQLKLDGLPESSVEINKVFESLPVKLKNLEKDFLLKCQLFHDNDNNWNSKGLTETGMTKLENIISHFNLDEQKFNKWLTKNI